MKIEKTEITAQTKSLVSVVKRTGPYLQSPLHYHPEIELVYILESSGKRIIGNKVEQFSAGDMIFLGPDLPHVWLNDAAYFQGNKNLHAEAIVAYFNTNVFGPEFYSSASTWKISDLFHRAKNGIRITGETHRIIAGKLESLVVKKDLELLPGLFEILSILADSNETEQINEEGYAIKEAAVKPGRLQEVLAYLNNNFHENITLDQVAAMANLTPQSLSRVFRTKTRKNFINYLQELRINHACKMLLDTEQKIVTIAQRCGYNNLSNFNKQFKKITGKTPLQFKSAILLRN